MLNLNISGLLKLGQFNSKENHIDEICVNVKHDTSRWNWQKDATAEWSTTCELGLEEKVAEKGLMILKAYNLQGQEVPVNTKAEVIILLYDNGTKEKTYVAE